MKNKNIDKSLWAISELEKNFFVLRGKNESSKILTKKLTIINCVNTKGFNSNLFKISLIVRDFYSIIT